MAYPRRAKHSRDARAFYNDALVNEDFKTNVSDRILSSKTVAPFHLLIIPAGESSGTKVLDTDGKVHAINAPRFSSLTPDATAKFITRMHVSEDLSTVTIYLDATATDDVLIIIQTMEVV